MGEDQGPAPIAYRTADVPLTMPVLAVVGVKLLGLYAFLLAFPHLAVVPQALSRRSEFPWYVLLGFAMPAVCYLGLGAVLLFMADWLVVRVMRVPDGVLPTTSFGEHFQAIAFSIVGVLVIVWGLGALAGRVSNWAANEGARAAGQVVQDYGVALFAEPITLLVVGTVLFLRGRGLASLWHRMRYGGVRAREAE